MKDKYNPKDIEKIIYSIWNEKKYFSIKNSANKKNFCIVLPPPNITGSLHMGHAFQQTIIDVIIRYNKMLGHNSLLQIGTDHAGIATQIIVEKYLFSKEGKKRKDYSKEEFIKKIWLWKKQYSQKIIHQMKCLGISADWQRERFTMDSDFSFSVQRAFISLYTDNLIYRKKSLVNWDINLKTAISDLEVETKKIKGSMWYIRYFFNENITTLDGKRYLVIATTRPETIIGDVAIAINPHDIRYKNLLGKYVIVPIIKRLIPIIFDEYVDIKKGTGCVKITPAHDFNDYKVGIRNKLPIINILNNNGTIKNLLDIYDFNGNKSNFFSKKIPNYLINTDRFLARKIIINKLIETNLIENIKNKFINIPYSERSGVIVEPLLTNQWYIKSKILAKNAIKAIKDNKIKFIPIKYKNMYLAWMNNIEDWCISRQLWWGHRIPVWYDNNDTKNIYIGYNETEIRKKFFIKKNIQLIQETDVLDTWFSSSLWTFATLGWPDNKKELNFFHPTDVLVSGFDIIFFWISRMIMMTMYLIKNKDQTPQIPFKTVYITGLIKDEKGTKMSKSKGNVIDPLDIINGISLNKLLKKRTERMLLPKLKKQIISNTQKQFPDGIKPYGTDALRFTLLALASRGRDIHWDMNRLSGYKNFCNKLWNVSNFVFFHINKIYFYDKNTDVSILDMNLWIIFELNQTIKLFHKYIKNYRFDNIANIIYDFTKNIFCDWYVEMSKAFLFDKKTNVNIIKSISLTLVYVLKSLLKLSHPVIPFITEIIWQKIKKITNINYQYKESIIYELFPKYNQLLKKNSSFMYDINLLQQIILTSRQIRSFLKISFKIILKIFFVSFFHKEEFLKKNMPFLKKLANIEEEKKTIFLDNKNYYKIIKKTFNNNVKILFLIENIYDNSEKNFSLKIKNLNNKIEKINKKIDLITKKLNNINFINKAPINVIEKEKNKLIQYKNEKKTIIQDYQTFYKLNKNFFK